MEILKSLKKIIIVSTIFLTLTSFQTNKYSGIINLSSTVKGSVNSTPVADNFMQYTTPTSSFIKLFNDNKSNKMRFIFVFQKEYSDAAAGTNHYNMKMYLWVSGGLHRMHYVECRAGSEECTTELTATTEIALDNPSKPGTHEPFTLTVLEIRKADMLKMLQYFDDYTQLSFIPYYDDKTAKIPFVNLQLEFSVPPPGKVVALATQTVNNAANPVPPKPPVK